MLTLCRDQPPCETINAAGTESDRHLRFESGAIERQGLVLTKRNTRPAESRRFFAAGELQKW